MSYKSFRYETDDSDDYYVSWEGDRLLRKLATNGISSLVIGNNGSGKSVSVALAEFDENDQAAGLIVIPGTTTVEDFETLLFAEANLNFSRRDPARPARTELQWQRMLIKEGYKCTICQRNCYPEVNWPEYRTEDEHFSIFLDRVEGHCPLRLTLVKDNLWRRKLPLVIDVNSTIARLVIDLTVSLLKSQVTVVLVASPEVGRTLARDEFIKALPAVQFPSMANEVLLEIAEVRGTEIEFDAEAAQGNPRKFLMLTAAKQFGAPALSPVEMPALAEPETELGKLVAQYIESHKGGKAAAAEISEGVYRDTGIEISPEIVGRNLKQLGITPGHTRRGNVYQL